MEPLAERWANADRVLCVRLDAIGDVVMTGPAIRALAEQRPGRHVAVLTSTAGAQAASLLPGVSEVIFHAVPWMKAGGDASADAGARLVARLRNGGYEAAAIFTVYSQSPLPAALLCHLAGIPLRLAHCRENPYALLGDGWVPEREPEQLVRHEVRRQLDLVAAAGAVPADERLRLDLPDVARERAAALLGELDLAGDGGWIAVHPGSTAPSRRYPVERWAECCAQLARDHGLRLLLTGDAGERRVAESIRAAAGPGCASLAGRLDLPTLAAVLERAPLLLAGNTGPVHVAAAMGTPVVDVYALTNPQHRPWGVPHRLLYEDVPCRWCYKSVCPEGHHRCLRGVPADAVAGAAMELLGTPALPAGPV